MSDNSEIIEHANQAADGQASPDPPSDELDLIPVRLATWKHMGDQVVLIRPRPAPRGFTGLLDLARYYFSVPRIRLDEIGSFVWLQFDGTATVREVAHQLRAHFAAGVDPAEERVARFTRILHAQGLIRCVIRQC